MNGGALGFQQRRAWKFEEAHEPKPKLASGPTNPQTHHVSTRWVFFRLDW